MSLNSTLSNSFVNYLNIIQIGLINSLSIVLIIGLLGNFGCLIVFSQRELRSNGISLLFRGASLFNILVLVYGISISLYSINHISPDTYSILFCKFRLYIRHILLMIVRTYIILGCAASFALSSSRAKLRSLCEPRCIKWFLIVIPLIWPLIAIHMPILTILDKTRCISINNYILPFAIYFFLVVGIIPVVLMILFLFLTKNNLRKLHNRIQPSIQGPFKLKSRDQQFIRMLTSLVVMYTTTNLFYPTNVLYLAITNWTKKSSERIAIESLISSITTNHILYINNVSPFYLFIYSSKSFRKLFLRVIYKYLFIILRKNRIQPFISTSRATGHNR